MHEEGVVVLGSTGDEACRALLRHLCTHLSCAGRFSFLTVVGRTRVKLLVLRVSRLYTQALVVGLHSTRYGL